MGDETRPPPSSAVRTVVVWLVLLLFFVAVYVLASLDSHVSTGWWLFGVLGFTIVILVFVMMWNVRIVRRFNADNNAALAALHRGDLVAARRAFEPWCRSGHKRVATTATHNLGWTMMRQAELRAARDLLMANDRKLTDNLQLSPVSAVDIALLSALLGDVDIAKEWLTTVDKRLRGQSPDTTFEPMQALTRAIILCRDGAPADAVKMLDERWAEREAAAKGEIMRPLRVVRAFAIAATTQRNAGMAEAALQLSKPAYPEEYTFLGAEWPEMRAFLAANNLDRT